MSGFSYPPAIFDSATYNSTFYSSLDPTGYLTYAYSQTLYLDKNDYRLSYVSRVSAGIAQRGIALVPDSSLGIGGLGALSFSSLTVGGSAIAGLADYVLGITPGTAAASKALVLDASRNVVNINALTASPLTGTLQTAAQTSITSVGTLSALTIDGNLTFSGASRTITGLSLISATTIGGTLSTAAQPNITSIGTLGSLTVSANSADVFGLVNSSGSTAASLSFNSGTYYASVGLRANSDVLGESNNFTIRHNSIDVFVVNTDGSIGLGGYSPDISYALRCGSPNCDSLAIAENTYGFSTFGAMAGTQVLLKLLFWIVVRVSLVSIPSALIIK